MCLGDLNEKSVFVLPWPLCLAARGKGSRRLFLISPLQQGGVSASITPQVCLGILPLVLYRYGQPWGEGCSHPLQTYLSLTPQTHTQTTWDAGTVQLILIKDDNVALGEQSSQRQGMGKACMENQDAGMKHLELSPDLQAVLPINWYLCEGGRNRATRWRADMLPCLPDTSLSLQGPSLLRIALVLPQQGVTLPPPL